MNKKDKLPKHTRDSLRNIIAQTIEETGADAIVVGITRHIKNETETFLVPWGNLHAVRGLAEYIYEKVCDVTEEEDADDDSTKE